MKQVVHEVRVVPVLIAALPSFLTETTEVEVGFTPTREIFESVLTKLRKRNSQIERSLSLDVSFNTQGKTKSSTTIRVTISGDEAVKGQLRRLGALHAADSIVIFKDLVNIASNGNTPTVSLMEKTRNKVKTKPLNVDGLVLKVSDETPVSTDNIKMISKLSKADAKRIHFRLKERFTQVITSGDFIVKIDATIVVYGNKLEDVSANANANVSVSASANKGYEIEVELMIAPGSLTTTIPKSIRELFAKEVENIHDLLHSKPKLSHSTSQSPSVKSMQLTKSRESLDKLALNNEGHIVPKTWMLANRKGFFDWMYKTFNTESYAADKNQGVVSLFPHQKVARDFLQYNSPYRGILLYHGLGSGKTISSIAAAEGFVRNNKKVIVMLPASLETNYREEILKSTTHGNPSQKMWDQVVVSSSEGANTLFERIHVRPEFLENKVHIWIPSTLTEFIPDIQRVTTKTKLSWNQLSAGDKEDAKKLLEHLLDTKYTFIKYNGISAANLMKLGTKFFEDAFIVIDEAHNFISRVVNGGSISIARRMYHLMMEAKSSKVVLLTGTPIINHPFELSVLLNLARGTMNVYNIQLGSKSNMTTSDIHTLLENKDVAPYVDQWMFSESEQSMQVSMLPDGYINTLDWNGNTVIKLSSKPVKKQGSTTTGGASGNTIVDNIISYLRKAGINLNIKPIATKEDMYAFPSRKEEFIKHFIDETDIDNPRVKNMDLFSRRLIGLVSYYKSVGEEYFPTVSPTVIEEVELCDTQFNTYVQARDKERRMENQKKRRRGLFGSNSTVYRAFSRMACNYVFPKEIPRIFPNDIRNLLKREIDIVDEDEEKVATKEIQQNTKDGKEKGPKQLKDAITGGSGCYKLKKAECTASNDCDWIVGKGCHEKYPKIKNNDIENVATKQKSLSPKVKSVINNKVDVVKNKDVSRKYDIAIANAMRKLEAHADKYLTIEALKNNYSSKLAKIYYHVNTSPGKVLLYSQFRSIEGIGVASLILKHQNYVEVKLENTRKGWRITNGDEVLKPKYDNKRFIVFDGDRDRTQIMLQIFNGYFTMLPSSLQEQLAEADTNTSSQFRSANINLHGDIIKLLMITQSGAEGISLKCVRRVLIMEPFWNQVRMDQVIGRAVRTGSHLDLPPSERTVDVFVYTSVFTPNQLKENFTLRRLDNSITSDTHILQIAQKKDILVQNFMNALKTTAIDCRNNAAVNKPTAHGLACYAFPIPFNTNDYSFTPSLEHDTILDSSYKNKLVRNRKVQGRVVSIANTNPDISPSKRVKYVKVDEYPDKLYDYNAYKNAGVLVEVQLQ